MRWWVNTRRRGISLQDYPLIPDWLVWGREKLEIVQRTTTLGVLPVPEGLDGPRKGSYPPVLVGVEVGDEDKTSKIKGKGSKLMTADVFFVFTAVFGEDHRCVCVFNAVALCPAGPADHPPQPGPEGGGLPALHPAAALRQRRLLHQGVCPSVHRPGHGEELSQVHSPARVCVGGTRWD